MKNRIMCLILCLQFVCTSSISLADSDARQLVPLPSTVQQHMMSNMRDHLKAINEILFQLGKNDLEAAAELAEQRLGVSSLESHGADHMADFMPEGMRQAGTNMHKAASRFALTAQEGELQPTYKMLAEVTESCVTCHAAYRIR